MRLPLIGQNRPIFIGNLGIVWIYFYGLTIDASYGPIASHHALELHTIPLAVFDGVCRRRHGSVDRRVDSHNSQDAWDSAMSNLDALLDLRPQPDVEGPGFFSDGDMLHTCSFGHGNKGKTGMLLNGT
jgi:hypothetical protein